MKTGMALRTRISGLLLGLVLTINAYGQPPSAPATGAVAGPVATAYYIKFKVKPGKNADFEQAGARRCAHTPVRIALVSDSARPRLRDRR